VKILFARRADCLFPIGTIGNNKISVVFQNICSLGFSSWFFVSSASTHASGLIAVEVISLVKIRVIRGQKDNGIKMDNNSNQENMFASTESSDLCDSIKNIHEILRTVGAFFSELSMNDENGNGLLIDFKRWGIKTITKEMLNKQLKTIDRIKEIYDEERKRR